MKQANIVRAFLVFMAISSPSAATIYFAQTDSDAIARDIYAFKPTDMVFPGFVRPEDSQWPEGHGGFSGFVREVRSAVKSTGGAPRTNRTPVRSFSENGVERQITESTYEASIPIRLRNNTDAEDTAEVFLGFSVKQVLNEVLSSGTVNGKRRANSVRKTRSQAASLPSVPSPRGSLGGGGSWLGGGFLSEGSSFGTSGFGFELQPLTYPKDVLNGPYRSPHDDAKNSKGLKDLRKLALDLIFNPYIYFSALVVCVIMLMARFRRV